MLQVKNLSVVVGGVTLVQGVSFNVRAREKVGVVGRNGAGKTSLVKVLGGEERQSKGLVQLRGGVGYLPQDPRLDGAPDDITTLNHVLSGRGLAEIMVRMEKLLLAMEEDPSERNIAAFSQTEEAFRIAGGYSADSEARRLAAGLGVKDEILDLPLAALSGGQRRRVELLRILFAGSDVLLLDEPTNHLDVEAKAWMLDFLRSYQGALVVISHDLDLLDEAITRVLHLDRGAEESTGTMVEYRGTYSQYVIQRQADEIRQAKEAAGQAKEIARMQTIVDRFGAKASKASMAHDLEKRIARLEAKQIKSPTAGKTMKLRLPAPPAAPRTVLECDHLTKAFSAVPVFEDVSFGVGRGDRVLIMGLNGAGKTSLLRILAGVTQPSGGAATWSGGVSVGYYAQEHEGISEGLTLVEHMIVAASDELSEREMRSLLGMFGLTGDKANQDASTLSGGEKTKLALAQLFAGRHNLVLLDEPTNNLDPTARDAVADALAGWPGTIIFVSHDTDLVSRLRPDRVLVLPEGTVEHWKDELLDAVTQA
jgi:ATPase subunit of ABC transporter with duplicated ATPase domains